MNGKASNSYHSPRKILRCKILRRGAADEKGAAGGFAECPQDASCRDEKAWFVLFPYSIAKKALGRKHLPTIGGCGSIRHTKKKRSLGSPRASKKICPGKDFGRRRRRRKRKQLGILPSCFVTRLAATWCGRQELNLHGVTHKILSLARLPVPPRPHILLFCPLGSRPR